MRNINDISSSDRRICADPSKEQKKGRKIISIFIRNDPISIQAVCRAFNVPCVENQNQSVRPLVPSKGSICRGLISNSAVQLIFTDMYIQISLQTPDIRTKKKSNIKSKKIQKKPSNETIYLSFKIEFTI